MSRPLREHFEVPTDAGVTLRTFDYIEELEKYIDHLEALRQPDVSRRSEQLNCDHEWKVDKFDCYGFPAEKYCDKCCKKEAV